MLRKIPEELGYSKQQLALLRECLLQLIQAPPQKGFGVCGTLDHLAGRIAHSKEYFVHVDGYDFVRYAAHSWEHSICNDGGVPVPYFIPSSGDIWLGDGRAMRIGFMKHCLGVVAKLEEALPV